MLYLASIESFLGSLWFAGLACAVGYVAGQVFPISKISELFKRN